MKLRVSVQSVPDAALKVNMTPVDIAVDPRSLPGIVLGAVDRIKDSYLFFQRVDASVKVMGFTVRCPFVLTLTIHE